MTNILVYCLTIICAAFARNRFLFIINGIFLGSIAAFKDPSVSRDGIAYVNRFYEVPYQIDLTYIFTHDLAYPLLSWVSIYSLGLNYYFVFFIFVSMGIALKLYTIDRLSPCPILSLVLFISYYYYLHEMTQIRIAVAIGFFFISIIYLIKGDKGKYVLLILLGSIFHLSILFNLIFLCVSDERPKKLLYLFFLFGSIIFGLFFSTKFNFIANFFPETGFFARLSIYKSEIETGAMEVPNLFNLLIVIKLLFLLFFFSRKFEEKSAFNLLVKIQTIGVSIFYLLSFFPSMATRLSEMVLVVDVLLVPHFVRFVRPKLVGSLVVLSYGVFHFLWVVYRKELIFELKFNEILSMGIL